MSEPGRTASKIHVVIMAGGSGTRFWPMSRRSLPKQFLALAGEKSLLRETYDRVVLLAGPERLWVVTGAGHVERVRAELPEVPARNIIGEPVGRSTAPCIGLAARMIASEDEDATVIVCPSDHVVRPAAAFRDTAAAAARFLDERDGVAEPWTVTFGIVPRYAAEGFGYIHRGERLPSSVTPFYRVAHFKEKPKAHEARAFLETGQFYWNSGIFVWKARGILRLIDRHIPPLSEGLTGIFDLRARGTGLDEALRSCFGSLPSISVDHGVLERAANVAVVEADFEWDDVGSWRAVERYGKRDQDGNSVVGRHVGIDTRDCILVGKKRLITTIDVKDLVVVETDDAILVCSKDSTERVKEIVDILGGRGLVDFV